MSSVSVPASFMEEFFNKNHSKSDGKFASGSGGRAVPGVRSDGTPVSDVRYYPGSTPFSKRAKAIVKGGGNVGLPAKPAPSKTNIHSKTNTQSATPRNAKVLGMTDKQLGATLRDKTRSKDRTDMLREQADRVRTGVKVSDPRVDRKIKSAGPDSLKAKAAVDAQGRVGKPIYAAKNMKIEGMSDRQINAQIAIHERRNTTKSSDYKDMVQVMADRAVRGTSLSFKNTAQKATPFPPPQVKTPTKLSPAPPYTLTTTKKVATLPTSLQRRIAKIAPGIAAAIKAEDAAKRK